MLDGEWVVNSKPRPLYSRERRGTHCIGGWVGPKAPWADAENLAPPPGFDPRIVQPVKSPYNDWAITAHHLLQVPTEYYNATDKGVLKSWAPGYLADYIVYSVA